MFNPTLTGSTVLEDKCDKCQVNFKFNEQIVFINDKKLHPKCNRKDHEIIKEASK